MEYDGHTTVSYTSAVVTRDISSPAVGVTTRQSDTALSTANGPSSDGGPSATFNADASYRVLTSYGSGTEIDLASYLTSGATSTTFALKYCDEFRGDYYNSAAVENGKLVLASNTLGHVHGPSTQAETVCTVTATTDGGSEDREFRLYTVSDRTPPPLPSGAVTLVEARAGELDVQISLPEGFTGNIRIGWRKAGEQPIFAASGVSC